MRFLIFSFLLAWSTFSYADGYFVSLFKTNDIKEAEEVSAKTVEKSKIIKLYEENVWVVAIGPIDIQQAQELALNIQKKLGIDNNLIIKFPDRYIKWDSAVFNASVGAIESLDLINTQIEKLRQLNAEEEKKQRWLASPEYKKQQDELERKRIALEKREEAERIKLEKAELAKMAELERKRVLQEKEERAKTAELERKRILQEKEERARLAIDYPYYALITCGYSNSEFGLFNCMSDRSGGTELELRNGSKYGMYKNIEVINGGPGRGTRNGYLINLRSTFDIKIQNASKNFILGVEIRERTTERILFQKKAGLYDVISVRD